jgi:hypothetical protein
MSLEDLEGHGIASTLVGGAQILPFPPVPRLQRRRRERMAKHRCPYRAKECIAMKNVLIGLALLAAIGFGDRARAEIGAPDPAPGATMLLPYFEVDSKDPSGNGVDTLVTIGNASATAILVHVTFWTDLGFPTLRENIYLTGYDMQTMDLREYFVRGKQVRTASVGQDRDDSISPHGPISQDINFASCSGLLPAPRLLTDYELVNFKQLHTGDMVDAYGLCASQSFGDGIARGYVTFEAVNNCTLQVPSEPGYFFPGGTGSATNQNVIFGEYRIINRSNGFAVRDSLTAIEANGLDPETSMPGQYTFYGRYLNGSGADNREPLPTTWATRFDGRNGGDANVVVWRDSKTASQNPFSCTGKPNWYPLFATQIVAFDDQENPTLLEEPLDGSFPAQANRVQVGGAALPVPFSSGWLFLNLDHVGAFGASSFPAENPAFGQGQVTSLHDGPGGADSAESGTSLFSPGDADGVPVVLPIP